MTDKIVEELTRRVEFLENRLMNHMVFKSSSPTSASDCLDTVAKGLGKTIMEYHPLQYTEQGTGCFVEIRVLNHQEVNK